MPLSCPSRSARLFNNRQRDTTAQRCQHGTVSGSCHSMNPLKFSNLQTPFCSAVLLLWDGIILTSETACSDSKSSVKQATAQLAGSRHLQLCRFYPSPNAVRPLA